MQMIKHSRFVEAKLGENAALFPFRIYFRSWLSLNRNCYARLSPRVIKEQGRGVIHRSEGRDRAYRPEIVNSITVFRNERLNGGIHAESKRFSKSSGTERKGFEAFYELRDGFVRMMGCWGRDWVGRRGTVISGSCRKLTVLPPFDSRESIFQVRSCPLTQLKLCVTEGNNNSAAVNVRSTTFWVHFGWFMRKRAILRRFLRFRFALPTDCCLHSVVTSATRRGDFRENFREGFELFLIERLKIFKLFIF